MKFDWHGETYEMLDQERLTWVEMSQIEAKAGVTTEELGSAQFAGRALVSAAFAWMSVKRQNPTVAWDDFINSPLADLKFHAEQEQEEPAPLVAADADPLADTDGSGSETSAGST